VAEISILYRAQVNAPAVRTAQDGNEAATERGATTGIWETCAFAAHTLSAVFRRNPHRPTAVTRLDNHVR